MIRDWLWTNGTGVWLTVVSSIAILLGLIAVIRISGLRALSKMSSFDFAVTVAMGSIVAGVASSSTSLIHGLLAIVTLLGLQALIAVLRRRTTFGSAVDNQPVFLMWEGEFVEESMASGRVTRDDVIAKLREANVLRRSDVRAVVLETTGDVSVLHGDGPLDDLVIEGIAPVPSRSASTAQGDQA